MSFFKNCIYSILNRILFLFCLALILYLNKDNIHINAEGIILFFKYMYLVFLLPLLNTLYNDTLKSKIESLNKYLKFIILNIKNGIDLLIYLLCFIAAIYYPKIIFNLNKFDFIPISILCLLLSNYFGKYLFNLRKKGYLEYFYMVIVIMNSIYLGLCLSKLHILFTSIYFAINMVFIGCIAGFLMDKFNLEKFIGGIIMNLLFIFISYAAFKIGII